LKKSAEKEMVPEAAKQPIAKVLAMAPGLGPLRVAQLLPVVVTPHRVIGTALPDLCQLWK